MADVSRDLLGGDMNFPTCMNMALAIRDALQNPQTSIDQLASLVGADPLITARVLHMSNCVTLNPSGKPIISVAQAISRLGFNVVRAVSLVLALEQLTKSAAMAAFAPLSQKVWEHSIQVAALSRVLAKRLGYSNADEAMLTGLVSDMGVFYLMYRAAAYPEYHSDHNLLYDLLHQASADIGGKVLVVLGLPDHVIEALQPASLEVGAKPDSLNELVHLSRQLAAEGAECFSVDGERVPQDKLHELQQAYADLLAACEEDISDIRAALMH